MNFRKTILGLGVVMFIGGCESSPSIPVLPRSNSADAVEVVKAPVETKEADQTPAKEATPPDIQAQALAILDRVCVSCHSASNIQGNFGSLDNVEAMLASGLVSATGAILDKGPTSIVKQNDAPPQFLSAIVNGLSCMNCHGAGLLFKKDEVRAFAQANVGAFSAAEMEKILNLYPEEKPFKDQMDKDNLLYFNSLKTLDIDPKSPDPVNQAFRFYNRSLSKNDVREELGITEAALDSLILNEPYRTQWTSLRTQGFISRQELCLLQTQAIEQARIELNVVTPLNGDFLATPDCMFASQVQMDNCLINAPAAPAVALR